jgi:hypothetical protein
MYDYWCFCLSGGKYKTSSIGYQTLVNVEKQKSLPDLAGTFLNYRSKGV